MKKLSIIAFLTLLSLSAFAQSSVSNLLTFTKEDVTVAFIPPCLDVEFEYRDSNGNNILEADEEAQIIATISNTGGKATNVEASLNLKSSNPGITFKDRIIKISEIEANSEVKAVFHIKAGVNIPTLSGDKFVLEVNVKEPYGYDAHAQVQLATYALQKAKLQVQGVEISDYGRNLSAKGTPDNKIQRGETVEVTVILQNVGQGVAGNVRYAIQPDDPDVHILGDEGYISAYCGEKPSLSSGETTRIRFRLSVNNNYLSSGKYLPVSIIARERYEFGNLASNINIPFDAAAEPIKTQTVTPDRRAIMELQKSTKVIRDEGRQKSRSVNIKVAPKFKPSHSDAIAIVFGAEKNKYGAADALYAANDAENMAGYFRNSLGVKDVKLFRNEEVTSNTMEDIFDPVYGDLASSVEKGRTDVFVYFSGHGIPDKDAAGNDDVFLFPYDARSAQVSQRGYSVSKLYENLNKLEAKSVTVILDACFSGASKSSATQESQQISNTKGVARVVDPQSKPWKTNPNFRVFASSSSEQTSLSDDASESGLFTYYLAAGIQGGADTDSDGAISMSELVEYVSTNVSEAARKQRRMDQTPQFYGNGDFLVSYTE